MTLKRYNINANKLDSMKLTETIQFFYIIRTVLPYFLIKGLIILYIKLAINRSGGITKTLTCTEGTMKFQHILCNCVGNAFHK